MVDIVIDSLASDAQAAVTGYDEPARLLAELGVIAALGIVAVVIDLVRLVRFVMARLGSRVVGEVRHWH
jgi:myo-inositol-1-phosphate synthase